MAEHIGALAFRARTLRRTSKSNAQVQQAWPTDAGTGARPLTSEGLIHPTSTSLPEGMTEDVGHLEWL